MGIVEGEHHRSSRKLACNRCEAGARTDGAPVRLWLVESEDLDG